MQGHCTEQAYLCQCKRNKKTCKRYCLFTKVTHLPKKVGSGNTTPKSFDRVRDINKMKTEDLKSCKVIEMTQSEMIKVTGGNIFKNAWGWIKDHVSIKIEGGATIHT